MARADNDSLMHRDPFLRIRQILYPYPIQRRILSESHARSDPQHCSLCSDNLPDCHADEEEKKRRQVNKNEKGDEYLISFSKIYSLIANKCVLGFVKALIPIL